MRLCSCWQDTLLFGFEPKRPANPDVLSRLMSSTLVLDRQDQAGSDPCAGCVIAEGDDGVVVGVVAGFERRSREGFPAVLEIGGGVNEATTGQVQGCNIAGDGAPEPDEVSNTGANGRLLAACFMGDAGIFEHVLPGPIEALETCGLVGGGCLHYGSHLAASSHPRAPKLDKPVLDLRRSAALTSCYGCD